MKNLNDYKMSDLHSLTGEIRMRLGTLYSRIPYGDEAPIGAKLLINITVSDIEFARLYELPDGRKRILVRYKNELYKPKLVEYKDSDESMYFSDKSDLIQLVTRFKELYKEVKSKYINPIKSAISFYKESEVKVEISYLEETFGDVESRYDGSVGFYWSFKLNKDLDIDDLLEKFNKFIQKVNSYKSDLNVLKEFKSELNKLLEKYEIKYELPSYDGPEDLMVSHGLIKKAIQDV